MKVMSVSVATNLARTTVEIVRVLSVGLTVSWRVILKIVALFEVFIGKNQTRVCGSLKYA